jgi:hypothetical protein
MKQYAAVQALHRLGRQARDAEAALWAVLSQRPSVWRGLYVARRVLDDDAVAYTDDIVLRDVLYGPKSSYATPELFILETLREVGAAHDRLTDELLRLAQHESQDVRLDVARQLGLLDGYAKTAAADVLIGLLLEPGSLLREMLGDESAEIRKEAMQLFTRLGSAARRTVPTLAGLLSARENRVRLSAAATLGEIGVGASQALPALERALRFERLREGDDYKVMEEAKKLIQGQGKETKGKQGG